MITKKHFKLALIPLAFSSLLDRPVYAAEDDAAKDEKVIVTGSRIRQSQAAGNAPVLTLDRDDLAKTGLTSVADVLQKMSTSGAALNTRFNSSGNFGMPSDGGGVGAGGAEVDMRHLGSDRVLVLVDGRRWVSGSSASGVSSSVDLNTVPLAIVDRIEVLEDGASSIYGSDAIAGVVNIITRKDVNGWEMNASYGGFGDFIADIEDGETTSFDMTFGATGARHSIVTSFSHVDQNVVYSQNRSLATEPLFGTGNTRGSSATPFGRFVFFDGNGDVVSTTPNGDAGNLNYPSDFHDFTDDDRFNYAAFNLYVTPSKRTNVFTRATYDLSNDVTLFTQAMFNNRRSKNQAAPEPIFIGPDAGTGGIADTVSIDVTNPYNPFGVTLDENNFIFAGRRPIENGPRQYSQDVNTYYFTTGLEGTFDTGQSAYYWDVSMSWGTNRASQIKTGALNAARIKRALGPLSECQADPLCVPLNIFGRNSISQQMLDYISFTQKDASQNKIQLFNANINGELFEMPAGYAGFAAGYEHRVQSGFFEPDAIAASGETMGIPASPTNGSYDVDEYFLETKFPLLSGVSGAEYLEVSAAVRRSEYNTSANTSFDATTTKFGVLWRPIEELSLRATVSEGFRAPSIGELFNEGARNDQSMSDPCVNASSSVQERCLDIWPNIDFQALDSLGQTQISVNTGGNPQLNPEESESFTWGAVYSPDWFRNSNTWNNIGFELTFYDHEIKNPIQALDAQTQLNNCVLLNNDEQCFGIARGGNGGITSFGNGLQNLDKTGIETAGTDFKLNISTEELDWGRLGITWRNTFVEYYRDSFFGRDFDGEEFGSNPDRAIPEWKYDLTVDWSLNSWSASTTVRYMSKIYESCSDFLDGTANSLTNLGLCSNPSSVDDSFSTNIMDETYYVDFQLGYNTQLAGMDADFALGARNLFDQDPPLCTQCDLNSYLPGLYDPQGRFWYLKVSLRP
ncbi:TonB-dependent receptor plug domain-containing protein [Pleionea mediterranea]|uniref:Iron complex outermembrane receptor protein n=1 Tax=Pleionea mediterranea TaxID=523701 RepID=A0A316FXH9_9GAMM|nr:TonB-dependent receptor [Pleionea mediterranea]PWK53421.1 iron complex outermembrane receptor protein [Pleionea mediterranea]